MHNRILSGSRLEMVSHTRVEADADAWTLRALPNEDVYLFVKEMNNSRVVREANPHERHAAWKMVASGGAVAALLIAVLFPSAYSLLSGYKLETLRTEQMTLVREKAKLGARRSGVAESRSPRGTRSHTAVRRPAGGASDLFGSQSGLPRFEREEVSVMHRPDLVWVRTGSHHA